MSLPSSLGLPQEMMLSNLDFSIPPDAKSFTVKIQPSNIASVTTSFTPTITTNTPFPDIPFPSQNIIFDIPCGQSPSTFLDNRMTCLNFEMTVACTNVNGGSTGKFVDSYLRGGAYSWFDRMYITSQNGQVIEDISEFALVNDTLCALQMNNSVRDGISNQYGFEFGTANASQGHKIDCLSSSIDAGAFTTNLSERHSYSIPLTSGIIGCLADKMLNIGRTSKLQLVLQTSQIMPITGGVGTAFTTSAPTYSVTLSNMSISCEYIDIGINALQMLDQTLADGKAYIHGTTYRTSSANIASGTSGTQTLLAGIRASSVKSLFARFGQGGANILATANTGGSIHGKFDSFNPTISAFAFNIGGMRYPQQSLLPLLQPATCFTALQQAVGSFNNAQFQSCIIPTAYCRLSAGGTASGVGANNTKGATQEYNWNTLGTFSQAQFLLGVNLEVCARRGLLSGLNCTSSPIMAEMTIASAPTNAHTMYVIAMLDHVVIHDVKSGDIQVRI